MIIMERNCGYAFCGFLLKNNPKNVSQNKPANLSVPKTAVIDTLNYGFFFNQNNVLD